MRCQERTSLPRFLVGSRVTVLKSTILGDNKHLNLHGEVKAIHVCTQGTQTQFTYQVEGLFDDGDSQPFTRTYPEDQLEEDYCHELVEEEPSRTRGNARVETTSDAPLSIAEHNEFSVDHTHCCGKQRAQQRVSKNNQSDDDSTATEHLMARKIHNDQASSGGVPQCAPRGTAVRICVFAMRRGSSGVMLMQLMFRYVMICSNGPSPWKTIVLW